MSSKRFYGVAISLSLFIQGFGQSTALAVLHSTVKLPLSKLN